MGNKTIIQEVLGEISRSVLSVPQESISRLAAMIGKEKRIFCDGAGRSLLQVKGFAMRLTQMGFQSAVVGEATTPAITKEDLLFICSGSGETPMLIEHAAKAKEIGAQVFLITASKGSALEQMSDANILIEASAKTQGQNENPSVQPMGSLFEQSVGILCDIMVLFIMEKYGISSAEMYRNHSNLE